MSLVILLAITMEKSASFRHVECTYDSDWVTITQCMLQRLTELDGGDA